MIAAQYLLHMGSQANRYGNHVTDADRAAMLDLLERLHAAGEVDLKEPLASGIKPIVEHATFPVAILGVGNVGLDFFIRLQELDPRCLDCESRGMPVFIDAVKSHVEKSEDGYTREAPLNEAIDDILAFWARSIPVEQITWLDKPGDDPGAGLMGHIRSVGAFPELQRALIDLGFDPNAKRSGAVPTAASITSIGQFRAFMDNGGDLKEIVPVKWHSHPDGVALWEYIFEAQDHPGGKFDLLQAIGSWCDTQDDEVSGVFAERMYWWHLRKAANGNKEALLDFFRENPGWADRRDHLGRNALHVSGRLCPSFLNHVLNSKTLSHLIDEKDSMGHGAAAHLLPTLATYNRTSDAKRMADSLLRRRGRLRDIDENNECGLVVSYALDHFRSGMTSLPSPAPLYSTRQRQDIVSFPRLWVGTQEQYEEVADLLVQGVFDRATPGAREVATCANRMFKDACEAASSPTQSYSSARSADEPKREALFLFNSMPTRLQQIIAIAALSMSDPASKGNVNSSQALDISVDNPKVSSWIQSVLGDLAIEVPASYLQKQEARLLGWRKKDASGRPAAIDGLLKMVGASVQANALRSGLDVADSNDKGPDCEQSRPSPRL